MKNSCIILLVVIINVISPLEKIAQINPKILILDLALNDPGSVKTIQGNRNYDSIILKNVVPPYQYSITIIKEVEMLPPLNFDPLILNSNEYLSLTTNSKDKYKDCDSLYKCMNTLIEFPPDSNQLGGDKELIESDEKKLAKIVEKLEVELIKTACTDNNLKVKANGLLVSTKKVYAEDLDIGNDEKVTIFINRDSLTWTFIIEGDESGKWVTTYGFGFTSSLERATYYTKQIPDSTVYQIFKTESTKFYDLNYIPAVFFSYFPSQSFNKSLNCGMTAGFGFDMSAPVVFLGCNVMYRQNIGISFGVAFQEQFVLRDQYKEKEIISITLDTEQLHKKVYRPNIFISINFRFGENPFKNQQINK